MVRNTFSVFAALFLLIGLLPDARGAEDATPEISPVQTPTPTEEPAPTIEELETEISRLRQENLVLRDDLTRLRMRMDALERNQREFDRQFGVLRGQTLEQWHDRVHQRGNLQIMNEREMQIWHEREHRVRWRQLEPPERR